MKGANFGFLILSVILVTSMLLADEKQPVAPGPEYPELEQRRERLSLENAIAEGELKQKLADLAARKQRLELEAAIREQNFAAELSELAGQVARIEKQVALANGQLSLKGVEQKARLEEELTEVRYAIEKSKAEDELATLEHKAVQRELEVQQKEIALRASELQLERKEFEHELAKLETELQLRERRDAWRNRVNREMQYTKEPFKEGILTISDRRIALNDIITSRTADYITERINYFNNQDREMPIFIVIDRSPGGSVMAGYKILKAMNGSPAPVYVVVKSFAASMAAGITTMAEKSFAYPNAILLHHQILSGSYGNLTEQRERLEELEEWWRRLALPIAKKMGITLEEFIEEMYENRSTGDWEVFGDKASELKWVDHVVETIREESYIRNPDVNTSNQDGDERRHAGVRSTGTLTEEVDPQGHRFVRLPRLDPVDCYYLYNPDGYYRLSR